MASSVPTSANEFVQAELNRRLEVIEQAFDADGLCIAGDLTFGMDTLIRDTIEDLRQRPESHESLVIILTTAGGYIEVVQRIVETLRHHYDHIGFVVPDQALSAGTVFAMSGDEIWMDYYSRLGPIDPQVPTANGRWVPALGYLVQWERLLKKGKNGQISPVEFQLMIDGFDQAELYKYEQARELSVTLLKEWLVKYKFKNWKATRTRGMSVTPAMRKRRAGTIGRALNATGRWHSHGSGISMGVLQQELKLEINDLDSDPARGAPVSEYNNLLADYMMRLDDRGILHTIHRYLRIM